jgi:hypothetical protein
VEGEDVMRAVRRLEAAQKLHPGRLNKHNLYVRMSGHSKLRGPQARELGKFHGCMTICTLCYVMCVMLLNSSSEGYALGLATSR